MMPSAAVCRRSATRSGVSLLLMSPMDRAERAAGGEIVTLATIPKLVAIQERVARDTGCAFFNTFEAMGGVGTMGRWYQAEPRLVSADFIHPLPSGARIVGTLLFQAITDGFNTWKLQQLRRAQTPPPADTKNAERQGR